MNAIEFFESEAMRLPIERSSGDENFDEYLDGVFSRYLAEFSRLNGDDGLSKSIKAAETHAVQLCCDIREAVRAYLGGSPHGAFEVLQRGLNNHGVGGRISRLLSGDGIASLPMLQHLYRIRTSTELEVFRRKDIFHVPFELRHRVARQRYSIPGLPCLYLGTTLYVCWEELGRPPFHTVYASHFSAVNKESLRVLDFSITPRGTAAKLRNSVPRLHDLDPLNVGFYTARAVCWPLLAACSIRRLHQHDPFIVEYIVPQLLLQWVSRHRDDGRIDGIAYFSVRMDPNAPYHTALVNLVFPVQESYPRGHCPTLKRKFTFTEPGAWQLLEATRGAAGHVVGENSQFSFHFVPGATVPYSFTMFSTIEGCLARLDHASL